MDASSSRYSNLNCNCTFFQSITTYACIKVQDLSFNSVFRENLNHEKSEKFKKQYFVVERLQYSITWREKKKLSFTLRDET